MTGSNLTKKQLEAIERIKKRPSSLSRYKEENKFYELCLEAVKADGFALKYVEHQTPELCLEAVKEFGMALQFVKEQTPGTRDLV